MTDTIKVDPWELDSAGRKLRILEQELSKTSKLLSDGLTHGAPRAVAAQLAPKLQGVRRQLDTTALSSGRQSDTLHNRAALMRLWDGQGTPTDVARLVALTTGRNPVDAQHNKLTFGLIEAIAAKYGTKPAKGDTGVELQLAKWGKYWEKAKGLTGTKGINLPKTKLQAFMTGKGKWADLSTAVDSAAKAAGILKQGPDRATEPTTTAPVDHNDIGTTEEPAPAPTPEPGVDEAPAPDPVPSDTSDPPAQIGDAPAQPAPAAPAPAPGSSSTTTTTTSTTTTTTTTTTDASGKTTTTTTSSSRTPGSTD